MEERHIYPRPVVAMGLPILAWMTVLVWSKLGEIWTGQQGATAIGLGVTLVVGYLISLLGRPVPPEQLEYTTVSRSTA